LEHALWYRRVLTHPLPARRRRPPLSPRQEYEEFILQRIEDYKNQLSREQLLALADDAVRELDAGPEGQLLLTEVLVLEQVDRLIRKRLRLPGFKRWSESHQRMRDAQHHLTHWGLPSGLPLERLARCLEPDEVAITVGSGAAGAAMFLGALGVDVVAMAESVEASESLETRAAEEAVTRHVQVMVVAFGDWFPDALRPALSIVDPMLFAHLESSAQVRTMEALREATVRGGVHLVLPVEQRGLVRSIAPEALLNHYSGWQVDRGPRGGSRWFLATKP
jgi:hypothetical protein